MLTLEFDGLYREVSRDFHLKSGAGFMCYGWVILRDKSVIARGHGGYVRGQNASSNVAEYLALIEGLEALLDMAAEEEFVLIKGDAKSVIDQMQGYALVSASSIKPLYRRARRLLSQFRRAYLSWTPRRFNQDADRLTRRALQQLEGNPEQYQEALHTLEQQVRKGRQNSRLLPVLDLRLYGTA
jgi:ribonuclease HI